MKKTKQEILAEIGDAEDVLDGLIETGKKAELTAEQKKTFDETEETIKSLHKDLERLEVAEKRAKERARKDIDDGRGAVGAVQDGASETKDLNKLGKSFRFATAFQKTMKGKTFDGAEAEMIAEAQAEANESGVELRGNIHIPSKFIQMPRRKDINVATEGTDVVFTDYGGLIPILQPDPVVNRLGITTMSGLRGNVQWPRHNGAIAFAWEGESDSTAEMTPTFDNISVSPHRVAGYVDVSGQMLKQSVFVLEPWLRRILQERFALTVDDAVIDGAGTGDEPTGIFNYSGVNVLSLGSGSANDMTYAALIDMIRATKAANARNGNSGWLTNANGEFALARTPMQASGVEGNFIYKMDGNLVGRRFFTSEIVSSAFSEGGQSDLVGIIYGNNWQSAILAQWGGMDILFDPYTQALTNVTRFVCNAFLDVEIEQPAEFTICKDWDATDLPALT
jgi:HK97 family phage major capsid protein